MTGAHWQFTLADPADAEDCGEPIGDVVTKLLVRTLIDADRRRRSQLEEEKDRFQRDAVTAGNE